MKIKQIILLCFFVFSLSAVGQQEFSKEFSLGANAGVTFSTVDFLPSIKQNSLLGFNGGATARFISSKHVGIQGEINFSQRGWDKRMVNDSMYSRTLNYIEIPFLSHFYIGKKVRFVLNIGPKVAFLLSENTNANFTPNNVKEYKPIANKFDYGLCAGGGVEFRAGTFNYIIEGRYNFGLGDLFPNGRGNDFLRSSNRNISINFVVLHNIIK